MHMLLLAIVGLVMCFDSSNALAVRRFEDRQMMPWLVDRANVYTFTIYNKCDEPIQPVFEPALPGEGLSAWPVIQPDSSHSRQFRSDSYQGTFYAPIKGSTQNGRQQTTHGEFSVGSGEYDISL